MIDHAELYQAIVLLQCSTEHRILITAVLIINNFLAVSGKFSPQYLLFLFFEKFGKRQKSLNTMSTLSSVIRTCERRKILGCHMNF